MLYWYVIVHNIVHKKSLCATPTVEAGADQASPQVPQAEYDEISLKQDKSPPSTVPSNIKLIQNTAYDATSKQMICCVEFLIVVSP